MNVILLGPPGAGKGTQSKYLEDHFHIKQLSSGDMLRHAVSAGSPVGTIAKPYMDGGKLVPDEVVVGVVFETIDALPKDLPGFVLDGFPRTVKQAQELDRLLESHGKNIDAVIVVDVSDDLLIKRIAGRFTCANCGESYNDFFRLPKTEGVCDRCGSTSFKRRSDDNPETVHERLGVYHKQTKPLIDYYRAKGKLRVIDGELPIGEVKQRINEIVEGAHPRVSAP
ncbi:MAG: adenylate kinase [Rhodomicrobium sp.]|nr:adenylate kinase [Rhodomicrobium sp.]